jgi:hypothetical protein
MYLKYTFRKPNPLPSSGEVRILLSCNDPWLGPSEGADLNQWPRSTDRVRLLCEPGYVMSSVGNLTEGNSSVRLDFQSGYEFRKYVENKI